MVLTDWGALWRELASGDLMASAEGEAKMIERWRRVARQLDSGERQDPDPLLDFILDRLGPEMTVVDIGAGIGRLTLPIAGKVRQITAVEPLPGMRQVLLERVSSRGLTNVTTVDAPWMEAEVPPHDVAIAAHATYTTPDLIAYVRKMDACARRTCYLTFRIPAHDGVIGELSERIRGQWHDSPNFIVGYNLLLSAGYHPNVLMEPTPIALLVRPEPGSRRRPRQAPPPPDGHHPRRHYPGRPLAPPQVRRRRLPLARRHALGPGLVGQDLTGC